MYENKLLPLYRAVAKIVANVKIEVQNYSRPGYDTYLSSLVFPSEVPGVGAIAGWVSPRLIMSTLTTGQLEVVTETGPPRVEPLSGQSWVLGRSSQADIQLDLPTVSRRHAKLSLTDKGWELEDLGSTDGTWVEGRRIQRQILYPGQWVRINRFRLRVIPRDSEATEFGSTGPRFSEEYETPDLSVLSQVDAPRLDVSHITALTEFGKQLIEYECPQERLNHLCVTVAGKLIRGRWAMALRLEGDDPAVHPDSENGRSEHAPQARRDAFTVLSSHPKNLKNPSDLHISQSAVTRMRETGSPVLASNIGQAESGVVEMSIAPTSTTDQMAAAVACPLSDEPDSRDLLYVNLPPSFGSTEWLALIALAVKQYQQAEAIWSAKQAMADRAAVQQDLGNARKIQRSLLPHAMDDGPLNVAWSYLPCDLVGGDLVDVVAMPDGRVLLLVADVTGHGLPAALTTLSVHSIVQTCILGGMRLDHSISRLNAYLLRYLPVGRFVTLAAVVIDPATGKTLCLCAGHHPPVVYGQNDKQRTLNHDSSLVLGIAEADYGIAEDTLEPGDTLLLSTDGLTELADEKGKMLGIDGVSNLVGQLRKQVNGQRDTERGVKILADRMNETFTQIQGDRPCLDDQTFLIASWRA